MQCTTKAMHGRMQDQELIFPDAMYNKTMHGGNQDQDQELIIPDTKRNNSKWKSRSRTYDPGCNVQHNNAWWKTRSTTI